MQLAHSMDCTMMKKVRIATENTQGEDRLSSLSDDLLHKILSYIDTRTAVQSSILSNRWRTVWTTLPFLRLDGYSDFFYRKDVRFAKFVDHVFFNRNHESLIISLELMLKKGMSSHLVENYVNYAISRRVCDLHVDLYHHYSLSIFNSAWLKELRLTMRLGAESIFVSGSCWNLPVLSTLYLIWPQRITSEGLPMSILISLPALKTLYLDHCCLPENFVLPNLRNLCLARCDMPQKVWHLPELLSLEMDDVVFPANMNDFFSALVKLHDLTLSFRKKNINKCFISCPQLVNLELKTSMSTTNTFTGNIVVMAPKLYNFSSVGIFPVICGYSKLENVDLKLQGCFKNKNKVPSEKLEQYYYRFIFMLPGLCSAKVLTLDLETIEALTAVSDFLAHFSSPFNNLKCLKLPRGYKESSLSSAIRSYLLGRSPRSVIVTTSTQDIHNNMSIDAAHMTVQEEHVLDYSGVIEQINAGVQEVVGQVPSAVGAIAGIGQTSLYPESNDFRLWQGHEVHVNFVSLLEVIMKKYPETFEHYPTKLDIVSTIKLNIFCITVTTFINTSMTLVNTEKITAYRAIFSDLERWGFNVSWLVSRLNYVEQLLLSQPLFHGLHAFVSGLPGLQTLGADKITEIQNCFENMGVSLALRCIGDNILS